MQNGEKRYETARKRENRPLPNVLRVKGTCRQARWFIVSANAGPVSFSFVFAFRMHYIAS